MNASPSLLPPILMLDDSSDDLFLLERLIRSSRSTSPLIRFADATEAIAYLTEAAQSSARERMPCFVFTDLNMPQMNGLEFLRWVRGEKTLNRLPVIMLTSSERPDDIQRATELGVTRYFVKFPSKAEIAALLSQSDHSVA